jgi:polysaccharide biosynthesis protein PslH
VRTLDAAIQAHPGRARIRVPGKLALDAVAREISELDAYLFPMISGANTRSSTLPIALGAGLPVIAIKSYETDPLFVDGENLLFADGLTGEAFAEQVLRLVADPALDLRISQGAKRLYAAHLSWEQIGDQVLSQI